MLQVVQGGTFESVYESGVSGLVGTVAVRIDTNQNVTMFGPITNGIVELGVTGVYTRVLAAPGLAGTQWSVLWSSDGTFSPETTSTDDLLVLSAADSFGGYVLVPIEGAAGGGPCQAWTTVEAVAECCGTDSDISLLEPAVVAASQVLYELSAHRYSGSCEQRVRPCANGLCSGPWGGWSNTAWGSMFDFGVYGAWTAGDRGCGCAPLSRVPLAGHATAILEVTVDGVALNPAEYRLDENRWLTRLPDLADPDITIAWPSCQNMEEDEGADGTFSILYEFGSQPPVAGVLAANELACAIHRTCAGGGSADECQLPNGVVRIQRQGITIDLAPFAAWGQSDKVWRTGLPLVDMFLNTYNPSGRRRRRSVAWSPDTPRFPRPSTASGS